MTEPESSSSDRQYVYKLEKNCLPLTIPKPQPPQVAAAWPPVMGNVRTHILNRLQMHKQINFLLILVIASVFIGCDRKIRTANNNAKKVIANNIDKPKNELKGIAFQKFAYSNIMKDSAKHQLALKILIKDSMTLIHIIEPILFDIYGEKKIVSEQPYEVHLFGDNWLAMGSLPKDNKGGTFEIVISRKTCEIIHLSHGK